jgi:ATP-dependent exoDNAse (exonuclease V) beta subunit
LDQWEVRNDDTKKTREYRDTVADLRHKMSAGTWRWSDWIKVVKAEPAKKSEDCAIDLRSLVSQYDRHPDFHADLRRWIEQALSIAAGVQQAFQDLKQERGLIDFIDQEHLLLTLLDDPEVREDLKGELDLLLVDEFQDTSPIQLAVFMKLAELAKEVIWVGDIKQAIYGFRSSDPVLMKAVVDAIESKDHEIEVLDQCRRSVPSLVALFNDLFVPAFEGMLSEDKVWLRSHRQEIPNATPLEFWGLQGTKKGDRCVPALAAGVVQLVASKEPIADIVTGEVRPLRAGDVAVLCRSNDHVLKIAQALSAQGLPVNIAQPGLLKTPEACYVLACLRRILDPGDTLASAEIIALRGEHPLETWLSDRLNYTRPEGSIDDWGIEGDLQDPVLKALHQVRDTLSRLSPTEALDLAIEKGQAHTIVATWGPDRHRAAKRIANLEVLRGMAQAYERHCLQQHLAATSSGFVIWLQAQAQAKTDEQAQTAGAQTIQVMTYHKAKGLEWPVVICTDLVDKPRSGLWGVSVSSKHSISIDAPLAGRRLKYWPNPFGRHTTKIPVLDSIALSDLGVEDYQRQKEEAIRLLYVGITRTRDKLILALPTKDPEYHWLNLLGADWLKPENVKDGAMKMPKSEQTICVQSLTLEPVEEASAKNPEPILWFREAEVVTERLPAKLNPSTAPALPGASLGRTINVGPRLKVAMKDVDQDIFGNALHAVIAAEITCPEHPNRKARALGLLQRHRLEGAVDVDALLANTAALIAVAKKEFKATRLLPEWPIEAVLANGQRLVGSIDLLVDTPEGWVIIDHKSFPGNHEQQKPKAIEYSGQLAAYRQALEIATGQAVINQWIHFVVEQELVELVCLK